MQPLLNPFVFSVEVGKREEHQEEHLESTGKERQQ